VFNGSSAVRWGFIFNNETDFASIDSYSGIGTVFSGRSAGDVTNGGGGSVVGINRAARFEMYGR
jgi:hypothetical protein